MATRKRWAPPEQLAPGRSSVGFQRILIGAVAAAGLIAAGAHPAAAASSVNGMTFHSVPGLRPPTVTVNRNSDPSSADIFVAPRNSYQRRVSIQSGPMILNGRGQLVWFHRVPGGLATDFEVQTYEGRHVLTWWQGTATHHASEDVIADSSYRTLAILHAGRGYATNSHEFQITPHGTALIAASRRVRANLKGLGGPVHGYIQDDVVQEVDIKSRRVLWQWHSYGHIPLRATYAKPAGRYPFDYFHLNSIQELPDRNFLISARNTWAVYEISRRTGRVIWTVGGKHSSFQLGAGARFSWQHDARLSGHTLSLFDDASDGPQVEARQSSAELLALNPRTMKARLVHRYTHTPPLLTVSQGNAQRLPDGNLFVGWGADPEFSEYTRSGRQVFDASFVLGVNTYRAYRFGWVGRPATRPALAVSRTHGQAVRLYASWNGATGVAVWRVLGGTTRDRLGAVARSRKTGFETTISLASSLPYLAVQALGSGGQVLGTSAVRAR